MVVEEVGEEVGEEGEALSATSLFHQPPSATAVTTVVQVLVAVVVAVAGLQ
jgi:hypothetical protein